MMMIHLLVLLRRKQWLKRSPLGAVVPAELLPVLNGLRLQNDVVIVHQDKIRFLQNILANLMLQKLLGDLKIPVLPGKNVEVVRVSISAAMGQSILAKIAERVLLM